MDFGIKKARWRTRETAPTLARVPHQRSCPWEIDPWEAVPQDCSAILADRERQPGHLPGFWYFALCLISVATWLAPFAAWAASWAAPPYGNRMQIAKAHPHEKGAKAKWRGWAFLLIKVQVDNRNGTLRSIHGSFIQRSLVLDLSVFYLDHGVDPWEPGGHGVAALCCGRRPVQPDPRRRACSVATGATAQCGHCAQQLCCCPGQLTNLVLL